MEKFKIFTFGDGYATNHIWPEWTALLSAIYNNCQVINVSGVGAGHEFLTTSIIDQYIKDKNGLFLVQWPWPFRFDKLIENNTWENIIKLDSVYKENYVNQSNRVWWLSSESKLEEVKKYHTFYIQKEQARLRMFNNMFLIKNLLKDSNYYFFLTANCPLTDQQKIDLLDDKWIWETPWQGMLEFSLKDEYKDVRQNEVQPSPIVHLEWVIKFLLPKIPYHYSENRLNRLRSIVNETNWVPFYWDRDCLWENILRNLDVL
jgi:hypothetical protein